MIDIFCFSGEKYLGRNLVFIDVRSDDKFGDTCLSRGRLDHGLPLSASHLLAHAQHLPSTAGEAAAGVGVGRGGWSRRWSRW